MDHELLTSVDLDYLVLKVQSLPGLCSPVGNVSSSWGAGKISQVMGATKGGLVKSSMHKNFSHALEHAGSVSIIIRTSYTKHNIEIEILGSAP